MSFLYQYQGTDASIEISKPASYNVALISRLVILLEMGKKTTSSQLTLQLYRKRNHADFGMLYVDISEFNLISGTKG